jgi:hypothetical protein
VEGALIVMASPDRLCAAFELYLRYVPKTSSAHLLCGRDTDWRPVACEGV